MFHIIIQFIQAEISSQKYQVLDVNFHVPKILEKNALAFVLDEPQNKKKEFSFVFLSLTCRLQIILSYMTASKKN